MDILNDYVIHLKKYPSTILSRCIGLHSLTLYNQTKYFLIMENVFQSKELQPHEKYDLKGSWVLYILYISWKHMNYVVILSVFNLMN